MLGLLVIKPHLALAIGLPLALARPRPGLGLLLSAGGLGLFVATGPRTILCGSRAAAKLGPP